MILTNQQKYIVEVLKQLKYLRVRQLHAMMQAHFGPLGIEIGEHRLNVMLRQLRMASNFVFLKKDLITYGQREISEHYLEAIDVMLELTENTPIFYSQDRLLEPCLLRFGGDGEMLGLLFSVTWLDIPGRIAAAPRMKGERIIWITDCVDSAPSAEESDWGFQEEQKTSAPESETPAPIKSSKSDRQKFFELKFHELDRHLTQEERQEWNTIYASYRGRSAITATIIGVDPLSVYVWNPKTEQREKKTMYCAIVVPYRVRIVIPASEMWEEGEERPDYVLQNMVGATVDLIIIKVEREGGFAIGSRRLANRSQRYFFAHREDLHRIGARVKCRMLAVGPRRCLVDCYGHDLDITQREMRYASIPDLRNEYHPGMEIDCIVKVFDPDNDKLEISIKETEVNPFFGAEQRHPVGSRRLAVISGKYGGGVFCNLPDGVVCMCNYSYQHEDADFMVGENVMLIVQRYEDEKLQMYGKIMSKW